MTLYAGLMSGTSMDGIDVALLDVDSHKLVHGLTKPYSAGLKNRLIELTAGKPVQLSAVGEANTLIGREFADAVIEVMREARVSSADIRAIGSHGQTVVHDASTNIPYTIQLGCAHTIAKRTGIPVVADFRTRDLVMGGQGAPCAPVYHRTLFSHLISDLLAVVNIGGIANITLLSSGDFTQGWDIGPGNCLMDAWIKQHKDLLLDKNGAWALEGKIDEVLLGQMQDDIFFTKSSPKSIGKEYFSLAWLNGFSIDNKKPEDIQATLLALTSWGIAESVRTTSRLLLCGGGAHNEALVADLKKRIPHVSVEKTDDSGISSDYIEAMMFAWLASKAMDAEPVDLRSVTGTSAPVVLGVIYPV